MDRASGGIGTGAGGNGIAGNWTSFATGGFFSMVSTCWRNPWIMSSICRICSEDLLIQMSRGSAWAPGALMGMGCGRAWDIP
jgi:hypothetical protein